MTPTTRRAITAGFGKIPGILLILWTEDSSAVSYPAPCHTMCCLINHIL